MSKFERDAELGADFRAALKVAFGIKKHRLVTAGILANLIYS